MGWDVYGDVDVGFIVYRVLRGGYRDCRGRGRERGAWD